MVSLKTTPLKNFLADNKNNLTGIICRMCVGPEPKPVMRGDKRTYRLWLDTNQYQRDMESVVKGHEVGVVSGRGQC